MLHTGVFVQKSIGHCLNSLKTLKKLSLLSYMLAISVMMTVLLFHFN